MNELYLEVGSLRAANRRLYIQNIKLFNENVKLKRINNNVLRVNAGIILTRLKNKKCMGC